MSEYNRSKKAVACISEHASSQPTLEAVTRGRSRGKYGNDGRGVTIRYGFHHTPLGDMFVAITRRGVCRMEFIDDGYADGVLNELSRDWPGGDLTRNDRATSYAIDGLFSEQADCRRCPLSLHVVGTDFQVAVWRALLGIPPGELTSYSRIAAALGSPQASRAVGNAVGANPVALLIPCHRVIQKSGAMGGYRWGTARKQMVQMWENLHAPTAP